MSNPPQTSFLDPGQAVMSSSELYWNVGQQIIIITEDKVRLCLIKYKDEISTRYKWTTPVAILIAILLTLVTADFHARFGLTGETWNAFFLFVLIASICWTLFAGFRAFQAKASLDEVIREIKRSSQTKEDLKRRDQAILLGNWEVSVGDNYQATWKFMENGTVLSNRGARNGTWTFDEATVNIIWEDKCWEYFNRPLDPNFTTGDSHQGKNKVNAKKLMYNSG